MRALIQWGKQKKKTVGKNSMKQQKETAQDCVKLCKSVMRVCVCVCTLTRLHDVIQGEGNARAQLVFIPITVVTVPLRFNAPWLIKIR